MHNHSSNNDRGRVWFLLGAWLMWLTVNLGHAQMIDQNVNSMSDVWEWLYDANGIDPDADPDGDGVANKPEALAGTNPFDSNSVPKISFPSYSATNFSATFSNAWGKFYQLQSVTNLGSTNWVNETNLIARSGATATLTAPANAATKYFRISVADVDTDGDGVSDWEEYKLGLDPLTAASNGQLDGNGQPLNDLAYATGKLAAQNVVTIYASDPTATEPDAGQPVTDTGSFTVTRGGFPLNAVTVNLGINPPGPGAAVEGVDHDMLLRPVTFPAGVSAQTITLTPLAHTNLMSPVMAAMQLQSGSGYTIGQGSNASVVIYPSPTPTGTGLTAQYFDNASSTYANAANFSGTSVTQIDATVDFVWGTSSPAPGIANTTYSIRWTGQVQPQYSETYVFVARTDDGAKLWVNGRLILDDWRNKGASNTNSVAIDLQAGVRYDLKLEYYQNSSSAEAHLSWFSPSQPKQIIPASRLYPTSVAAAPTAITSPLTAIAFLGQYFSDQVTAANAPVSYTASGLAPGLDFNSTNGVLSGIPLLAGLFPITLTASNAVGIGASVVNLQVIDTGSAVTRDVWLGIAGTNIADIPLDTDPTSSTTWGALQGVTDFGDNYGERIHGYLTAPVTGNYHFWIAGSDAAELWIANDSEPVNKVRRAWVNPGGTAPQQWNLQPHQMSPWLALIAGERYYIEVLHKAGAGAGDNWAVGWNIDPTGTNTVPAGVVPAYLLSRHFDLPPSFIPGTLYAANMLAQAGAVSSGVGSATLRVSADETQAILKFNYSGLTGPITGEHIHSDQYLSHPSQIIFDIDEAIHQSDGSYVWDIAGLGTLSTADVREIIREGKAYINLHTAAYPSGEINGHFVLAEGSQTFSPPPAPPAWTDDHTNTNAAARFLIQATFGPTSADIAAVRSLGYEGWIDSQLALPVSHHLPVVLANTSADPTTPYPGNLTFNAWWQQSITAPDQLRQRVAFALSEILVVSETGVLDNRATALSSYYDTLLDHAFGNFRDLIEAVTLHPAMGLYLDMRRNDKGDLSLGTHPNENYAREIQQLFSVGLYRLWPDGTLVMNSQGNLVPTYAQDEILGFARVFTGWNYYQANQGNGRLPTQWNPSANYTNPMVLVPTHHEPGTKRVLDNVMLPPAWGDQADSSKTNYDNYGLLDLDLAHDSIFNNDTVGPFICRQLIQRLVTSNPTRDYLYRVVQKFNDNGAGVRGDMQAVIKAILLDYEARSSTAYAHPGFGKQREPVLRVTAPARAFAAPPSVNGTYSQNGTQTISVTTASPHRMTSNDDPFLSFTDTSGNPPPPDQLYNNITATGTTTFTTTAPGLALGTYGQNGTLITVTNVSHGLAAGNSVYLKFTSGGAATGVFVVNTVPSTSNFTVTAASPATLSGSCLFPKLTGGGYVQITNNLAFASNIVFSTTLAHGLRVGDNVYVNFNSANSPADGIYTVTATNDLTHFTVTFPGLANRTQNGQTIYPLVAPPLNRSGNVTVRFSTWLMNTTDTGTSSSLSQTPLNSPTVFNFYFPDYKFPGTLASAGMTTPEFQLTSDTSVVLQMNFLANGIITGGNNSASSSRTNGLSSFNGGNGALFMDYGPWMTPAYTSSTAGVQKLVDDLSTLLCGGQLSAGAKTAIVNYVITVTSSNSTAQMRDRVSAAIHLIINAPEFTIQK